MAKPTEVITCGDLAALGFPWGALEHHNPRSMDAEHDALCYCYTGWEGATAPREARVMCRETTEFPLPDVEIHLCCLCLRAFGSVLHARQEGERFAWLAEQVRKAIAWRDRKRREGDPEELHLERVEVAS